MNYSNICKMDDKQWNELIGLTRRFVVGALQQTDPGHDMGHIERVFRMALFLADREGADRQIVALVALLHDVADAKFHGGNEEIGPVMAEEFLVRHSVDTLVVKKIIHIIRFMSFKSSIHGTPEKSIEFQVVQDADRLDAMGAIGIARAFSYGGFRGRPFYDPEIPPTKILTSEVYKNSQAPTINHFYEKLLLLKDLMNTETGKALAEKRHDFMLGFLDQFFEEWGQ